MTLTSLPEQTELSKSSPELRIKQIWPYVAAVLIVSIGTLARDVPNIIGDDGAFFLKYAENMNNGGFWRYNLNDPPIWGASAPLYPLLIAPFLKLGLPGVLSIKLTGMILINATACLTVRLFKSAGSLYGLFCCFLIAINNNIASNVIAGLETPLTLFLIAASLLCLEVQASGRYTTLTQSLTLSISFALLGVNKIDLIPLSIVLLFLVLRTTSVNSRSFALILGGYSFIMIGAYSFFWKYFGFPLPNSFLTKALHQNSLPKSIDWTWFSSDVFLGNPLKSALALLFLIHIFKYSIKKTTSAKLSMSVGFFRSSIALAFLLCYSTIGYTLKPPFEPYTWYLAPSDYALSILATFGLICSISSLPKAVKFSH